MKSFFILLSLCIAFVSTTRSQTSVNPVTLAASAPTTLPIGDDGVLEAYSLSLVTSIEIRVDGDTVTGTKEAKLPYPFKDGDPDHMASVASNARLRFKADPTKKLWATAQYYGTIGALNFSLFYGGKQFTPEKISNGYIIPADGYKIEIALNDWIPFRMPGVKDAVMITEDGKGNTTSYSYFNERGRIDMESGFIFFGREHVGQVGTLIVTFKDDSIAVYDMSGKLKPLGDVSQTDVFKVSMQGVRSLPADTASISYQSNDMLVRASYTKATTITLNFPATLPELPIEVRVVDSSLMATNPFAGKSYFGPFTRPVTEQAAAGQTLLFIFTYMPQGRPISSGGGKG